MTMAIDLMWLKVFQTANFLAACLVLFEIVVAAPRRVRDNDWIGPVVPFPQLMVGAIAASAMILMVSLPRVYSGIITWMTREDVVPLPVNVAATLLFFVVFWFHHYVRKENNEGTIFEKWRTDHLSMAIILVVSVAANVAESVGG